jgi:amidohydrolase
MTDADALVTLYQDLHRHPELAFHETRTAGIAAHRLREVGFEVTQAVGGTGVVGVLRNGEGPTVLLRADMDALPVEEQTGLPYASTARAEDAAGIDQPVMHACGHDVHVTCLIGACVALRECADAWRGTVVAVFQPAEEAGGGAQAMVDDGLFERFGRPDVVLGQHVTPLPAGVIGLRPGPAFAAADGLIVTLYGRGGHGSRPEDTVDPVVMAAATILRLQTVVSREVAWNDPAVVTIGAVHAGSVGNVISDQAQLHLSIRSFTAEARRRVLESVTRIIRAEALASGAPREPDIEVLVPFPGVTNDVAATDRTRPALEAVSARVIDPGQLAASEDVGVLATAAGAPCVYWLLGGADPAVYAGAGSAEQMSQVMGSLPANHSPAYAPVPQPTIGVGVAALVSASRTWLATAAS